MITTSELRSTLLIPLVSGLILNPYLSVATLAGYNRSKTLNKPSTFLAVFNANLQHVPIREQLMKTAYSSIKFNANNNILTLK